MTLIETDPIRRPRRRRGPLEGVRVTDFCWMGVGAIATRILADFGAEVIRIEDRNRLDMPRRLPLYKGGEVRSYGEEEVNPDPDEAGMFNNYNRSKLGITLNMRSPRGKELAEQLISSSSVVTENFAPDVMERWGLTNERVRELRSDVIYARMSGFGHSGPHCDYRSYGPVVQAVCGLSHVSGLPGREPSGWGLSYMDNQAAYYNASALLMAIYSRNATGTGTDIDISAVDAGVQLLGPVMLDVTVNGRSTRRGDYPTGNRLEHPHAAPHGVYSCVGEDRWVAIAVFDDAEWTALVGALGDPAWALDERFATQELRHRHQDELDEHIDRWTRTRDRHELMHMMQSAGVRAGAVQDAEEVNEHDPQMAHRQVFFQLDHPVMAYGDLLYRQQDFGHVQEVVEVFFLLLDSSDAYHEGQARGLPIGILNAPEDLLHDEHMVARGFFTEVDQPGHGPVVHPGVPYRFSALSTVAPQPAARRSEHTAEVLRSGVAS